MDIGKLQEYIRDKTGLDIVPWTVSRRADEFLENIERTEDGRDWRQFTDEQAEIMCKVFALLHIGIASDEIKEILAGREAIRAVVSNWIATKQVCEYVGRLFDDGVDVVERGKV